MRGPVLFVVLGVVLVAGAVVWWRSSDRPQLDAVGASGGAIDRSAPDDPPLAEPAEVATTAERASTPLEATRAADPTIPASDPLATWIVHAQAFRGFRDPYPDAELELEVFGGHEATGTPLVDVRGTTGPDGRLAWPLRPPSGTVTLRASSAHPDHFSYDDVEIVTPGETPPLLEVRLYPKDSEARGLVRDERGVPMAGVLVKGSEDETRTDDEGRYVLRATSLRGEIYVSAIAPGYAFARAASQVDGPGAVVTVNFDLVKAFRVRGRVVDEAEQPVEGATIRSFFTSQLFATSGTDGRFVLDHLEPGRQDHSVDARKDGYCEAKANVKVQGSELEIPDLVLVRGVRLEGRVIDESGAPVSAARLYLGFSPSAYNRLDAISRDDGSFAFPNVTPGEQTLGIHRAGFAPDRRTISVKSEPPVATLTIELEKSHFVGGVVRDEAGEPVPDVGVSGRHRGEYVDGRAKTDADGRFRLGDLPATDVSLELYGAGIVRKTLPLDALDHETLEITVQRAGFVAGRVVDADTSAPIPEFRIRFVAPDDPEKRGGGYSASWAREGHRFTRLDGTWDSKGEELRPGMELGVEVRAEGYAPLRIGRVVVVSEPDPDACLARLVRGARVTGRVVGDDGSPIAGAKVALKSANERERWISEEPYETGVTHTDEDGRFVIEPVSPGSMVLLVKSSRPLHVDGPFDVPASGAVDRVIRLVAGGTMSGVLLDAEGRPLAGETVMVFPSSVPGSDFSHQEARTGADGAFAASGLLDGLYSVSHVVKEGDVATNSFTRVVRVREGRAERVILQPTGEGVVAGTIRMKDGSEVPPRLSVMLLPRQEPEAGASTPPGRGALAIDGAFEISHVDAGEYTVVIHSWTVTRRLSGSATVTVAHDRQEVAVELVEMQPRR